MDIIEKLNRMLSDTTAHAMGSVDISQGPYGGGNIIGMRQKKKKKKCRGGDECRGGDGCMHEDIVTELAAFLRKRKRTKTDKLADREKKLQHDRYKLTPSELKRREDRLEVAKKKARKIAFTQTKIAPQSKMRY